MERRRPKLNIDKTEIVNRVLRFYDEDLESHNQDRDARIQRYAKFRQWTSGKDWPWADSSDAAIPDMMEKSLRLQDTLHNAVMAQRPPINAVAKNDADKSKQKAVDQLIDHQIFAAQDGETIVGEMVDAFVNDGVVTVFLPWVKERRDVADMKVFPPIPEDVPHDEYLATILQGEFPDREFQALANGWDFDLDGERVQFWTRDTGEVEMSRKVEVTTFDGPRPMVKEYDDILHPPRVANLQIPGPSNPNGAPHVIMRDFPTKDEIRRLHKQGYYDLLTNDDLDAIKNTRLDDSDTEGKTFVDDAGGQTHNEPDVESHQTLTRLVVFDTYDIDGDGIDEDVVWWVIKETRTLVKATLLTEIFPSNPPRRPFAESAFIPVKGRRRGISLLEMLEGIHDLIKKSFDQMVDAGDLATSPFGFYRASSMVKPETMRMWPGELYPLADPSRDINFPNIRTDAVSYGINLMTILGEMEDRLTLQSELSSGRVPAGRSSALRTTGNVQLLLAQSEARPERILRRFFIMLTQVWKHIHELNQHFLTDESKVKIVGFLEPGEDAYISVGGDSTRGDFTFDFKANVFNTSRAAMQESIGALLQVLISEIGIQTGVMGPKGIYRLFNDFITAQGHDPDRYLEEPSPEISKEPILVEEALQSIMNNQLPDGVPMEGARPHLQALVEFMQSDAFGLLDERQVALFQEWTQIVAGIAQREIQREALVQAAQGFAQGQQGQPGRPPENAPSTGRRPMVNPGELLDETMVEGAQ